MAIELPDLTGWEPDDIISLRDHASGELVRRARLEAAPAQLADLLEQVEIDGGNPDEQITRGREIAQERKTARESVDEAVATAAGAVEEAAGSAGRAIGGLLS